MLAIATVNVGDLAVNDIVDVDPDDPQVAGFMRARFLVPLNHQPMRSDELAGVPSTSSGPSTVSGPVSTSSGPQ